MEQIDVSGQEASWTIQKCTNQPKRVWLAYSWDFVGLSRNSDTICNSTTSFVKQCNYRVDCEVDLNLLREEQSSTCDRQRAFVFLRCLNGKGLTKCFIFPTAHTVMRKALNTSCFEIYDNQIHMYLYEQFCGTVV